MTEPFDKAALDESLRIMQAEFEENMATRVVAKLAALAGGFPSAQDIALIRDHISPNGVAYQNGVRAGRREALQEACYALNTGGVSALLELCKKEQV